VPWSQTPHHSIPASPPCLPPARRRCPALLRSAAAPWSHTSHPASLHFFLTLLLWLLPAAEGQHPVTAAGADVPPVRCVRRAPHPAARGGTAARPVHKGEAIPNPRSASYGGTSMCTSISARRKAHLSKQAHGTFAAHLPHAPVLYPMPQSAPTSAPHCSR